MRLQIISLLTLWLAISPAAAHVVFDKADAMSGGYYAGHFRVTHGCDGSPTSSVTIEIPQSINMAKPQPKPGWTIRIAHEKLEKPIPMEGGGQLTARVASITWEGHLDDAYFDEFGLSLKLPATTGPLYFPVIQTCATGETRWSNIPAAGQAWHDVPYPAPAIELHPMKREGHDHR